MKKTKIFTIGGATFDIFVKAKDQAIMELSTPDDRNKWLCLRHGGKITIDAVIETFGGGATNTGVAFARMGFDVSTVVKIGAEYGERVIENLQFNGVNTDFVKKTKRDRTAFSNIINTFDGDRTLLAYAGANRFFSDKDLPVKELEETDWIFLNHLTEESSKIPNVLLSILKKNPKIKFAWNPGKEQITQGLSKWKGLLKRTEILFLNKEEASLFARMPYKLAGNKKDDPHHHVHISKNFLPPYADDVSEIMLEFFKYGVKYVVITDGKNGAQASDGKNIYFCPVYSHKRIDVLGGGDSFASGFTSAQILGKNLSTSLIYGTLNAHAVVNQYGAQVGLLNRDDVEALYKKQNIHVTKSKLQK
ncbi:carbohydrate kinase family protein [Candidatus Peregrinibacteria bacterium]|nr:carbohydrate kinase family protein [Candidatus Peregrinibacteria bacterium]